MRYKNNYATKICLKRKCSSKSYARSLCKVHYDHLKRYGRSLNPTEHKVARKSANRAVCKDNYVVMLISGKEVLVDSDRELLSKILRSKWCIGAGGYPTSRGKYLHDLVIKKPQGMWIDHISRDKLDNRASNLRAVTPQQNSWNFTPIGKSKHRNVYWDAQTCSWRVMVNRKSYGRFKILEEAVEKALQIRTKLRGEEFA